MLYHSEARRWHSLSFDGWSFSRLPGHFFGFFTGPPQSACRCMVRSHSLTLWRFTCLLIFCSASWLTAGYLCKDDSAVFGVELPPKETQAANKSSDATTCPCFWLDFSHRSGNSQSCSPTTGSSLAKLACGRDASPASVALWTVPKEREGFRGILPEVWRTLE